MMLKISNFTIKYTQNKSCFCNIDKNVLLNASKVNICLKVTWDGGDIILWPIFSSCDEGTIGINARYAKVLNLPEDASVHVSAVQLPPVKSKVSFKPVTEDDWMILEANSEKLQYSLLDQIRVVSPNQKLLLWISPSLSICVTSQNCGVLEKHCEIEVQPFTSDSITELEKQSKNVGGSIKRAPNENPVTTMMTKNMPNSTPFNIPKNCFCVRVVVTDMEHVKVYHPYTVFASKQLLQYRNIDIRKPFYNLIRLERNVEMSVIDNENVVEGSDNLYDIVVEFKELTTRIPEKYRKFEHQAIFIPVALNKILQIETGKKLFFENIHIPSIVDSLEIIPVKFKEESSLSEFADIAEKFKSYVIECEKTENGFVINNGVIVQICPFSTHPLQFNVVPKNTKSALVTSETIRNCKIVINNIDNISDNQKISTEKIIDLEDLSRKIQSFEMLISECLQSMSNHLKIKHLEVSKELQSRWHFIILGPTGSGKSTICDIIAAESGLWHLKINCRTLKGKKDVHEVFSKSLKKCEEYSPSILICDDIDSLLPGEVEGTSHQDTAYYDKLTTLLKNMMLETSCVFVLMTAQEIGSINAKITQSKGDGTFMKQLHIPELEEVDRCEILQSLIKHRVHGIINVKKLNLHGCTSETVGFKMKDLVEYMDRKIFNLMKNAGFNTDLDELLNAINTDKIAEKDSFADVWSDIGGLKSVKQSLIESICWPLMYPALFPPQCGGILLYGPPGTGKTLIGSCVARLNSMSFISVKGPELLSKYIGQSEMAVRNIFQKARKKSPCILFFDEFDSLAPSRGHDSTGVTDRVVNQLLTQMDGVEGAIRGVIIMAATSRPDLIDAALLRPGRFGNTQYCSMPNEEDRLEILKTLSRTVDLTDDVDLSTIAKNTDGFSGADLKAVLVTAQLMALEKQIIEDSSANKIIPLSSDFLSMALAETKPSLSKDKLLFYERIYSRFNGDKQLSNKKVSQAILSKPRATLA